jgi:hypothetical protein
MGFFIGGGGMPPDGRGTPMAQFGIGAGTGHALILEPPACNAPLQDAIIPLLGLPRPSGRRRPAASLPQDFAAAKIPSQDAGTPGIQNPRHVDSQALPLVWAGCGAHGRFLQLGSC